MYGGCCLAIELLAFPSVIPHDASKGGDVYKQVFYLPDTTAMLLFCTQPSAESAKKVVWAGWPVGLGMRVESEGRGGVLSSPGSRGRIVGRPLRSRHCVVRINLRWLRSPAEVYRSKERV